MKSILFWCILTTLDLKFFERVIYLKKFVYADNAATTPVSQHVLDAMLPYYKEYYANPSSIYRISRECKRQIENAREDIAKCINAKPSEIFFTSGGSEADNWAIKGVAFEQKKLGKNHIITSKIEHHAVLHTVNELEKQGFEVTYLDVSSDGIIDLNELELSIKDTTALVSIMYANNEIGTIQPIEEIGRICKKNNIVFHTDAVQAIGNVHIDVQKQNIDLLSLTAHKIHGPKGVGVLYIKKGIKVHNLLDGGAQERGRRAGTENVAGIIGLKTAIEDACSTIDKRVEYLTKLRDKLIDGVLKIERSRLNGDRIKRLPGNANFCFEGIEGESLLLMLDMKGICASSGSACTSGSLDPSHVLLAIGLPHEIAHGSLRISLSDQNTPEDVDYILSVLPEIVGRLREMSPLWEEILKKDNKKGDKFGI